MTRALQKHVARRQGQTFADWFAELRELAGERWADVADQAPTVTRFGAAARRQRNPCTWWASPGDGSSTTIRIRYRIPNPRLTAGAVSAGKGGGVDQAYDEWRVGPSLNFSKSAPETPPIGAFFVFAGARQMAACMPMRRRTSYH